MESYRNSKIMGLEEDKTVAKIKERKAKRGQKPSNIVRNAEGKFVKGHDLNTKYTETEKIEVFAYMVKRSSEGEYYTIEEAVKDSPFLRRQFDRYAEEDPYKVMKEEIINNINAVVARKGLEGELNPAMSIFALKQRGWTDRQVVEQEIKEQPLFNALPEAKKQKKLPKKDS